MQIDLTLELLFDYVVRDLKNKMNDRNSYKIQFMSWVIFYSQKDNEEPETIHHPSHSLNF